MPEVNWLAVGLWLINGGYRTLQFTFFGRILGAMQ